MYWYAAGSFLSNFEAFFSVLFKTVLNAIIKSFTIWANMTFWCVFWHESIAKRGSTEKASCLIKYVLTHFKPMENSATDKKLIVWFDRCPGKIKTGE